MRRFPAEWERQAAAMLAWPHPESDWGPRLSAIEKTYLELAHHILQHEALLVVCHDAAQRAALSATFGTPPHPLFLRIVETDDTWVRDYGPITVLEDGRPVILDFRFNAWGGKYPGERDDQVTARLCEAGAFGQTPCRHVSRVLEGGAIEGDGQGTLIANRPTLIDPLRNPGLTGHEMEELLRRWLGIDRLLWLDIPPLTGDDTDGHVDTLVRFVAPDHLCFVACHDPDHPDHAALTALKEQLQCWRTATGQPYRLTPLPSPTPLHDEEGRTLPASYANFLILDDAVLMPKYDVPQDAEALQTLGACFPHRRILPVNGRELVRQRGGIHCAVMTLPHGLQLV